MRRWLARILAYLIGIHVLLTGWTPFVVNANAHAHNFQQIVSSSFEKLGTFVGIKVAVCDDPVKEKQGAIPWASAEMESLIKIVRSWDIDRDVMKVNIRVDISPVTVQKELIDIMLPHKLVSQLSEGSFDATCAQVGRLWNLRNPNPLIPVIIVLEQQPKLIGDRGLILDKRACTVLKGKMGMRIDLG